MAMAMAMAMAMHVMDWGDWMVPPDDEKLLRRETARPFFSNQ
jgi:hypothetical protein